MTFVAGTLSSTLGTVNRQRRAQPRRHPPDARPGAIGDDQVPRAGECRCPAGTVISNQGSVDSDQTVPTPTDADGVPGNGAQPTLITVGGTPTPAAALYVEKLVALQADSDASGSITQGDRMRYTIVLHNIGGGMLTNVAFSDIIPAGLAYVGGSASARSARSVSPGRRCRGPGSAARAGARSRRLFDVTIASVTRAVADLRQPGRRDVDRDRRRADRQQRQSERRQPADAVRRRRHRRQRAQPVLDVQKRWTVAIDTPPIGVTSPGDTLQYTITVANSGSTAATNVRLTDPAPTCSGTLNPCTSYVAGSLTTSQGAIVTEAPIEVNMGTVPAGGVATVSFRVLVDA